jgi:predicted MFS family arabinose efflux permease
MPAAVARLEARSYAATIAGPPLGGLLYSITRAAPFAGDAVGYTYSSLATLAVRTPLELRPPDPETHRGGLTAGLSWLWSNQLLRAMLLAAAGENFVFRALDLAVILAARDSGATSTQIGVMLAIAGTCGLAGALIATRLAVTTHPSMVVLGIFWSTTALIPIMAIDPDPYILGALLGAAGMLDALEQTYQAMPEPKIVIAAGVDAISGGLLGRGYASQGGLATTVPVDVFVPGSPPSPFGLLYGILLALGQLSTADRNPRYRSWEPSDKYPGVADPGPRSEEFGDEGRT